MWLISVLSCITLEVVLTNNVPQRVTGPVEVIEWEFEDRMLDYDNKVSNRDSRWPLGVVSYYLDNSSYDYLVAERVRLAMNTIEETSCVRFKSIPEPWSESHWIHITNKANERECTHNTASNDTGLEIVMTMGIDCLQRRDILHLLMHALGFSDEITHPKRDQYVRVLWDNINPVYRPLFRVRNEDFFQKTTEYDPISIMHFHDRAYTKNGHATIESLIPGLVINPSRDLSPLDKMKLRLMFGHECNRRDVGDLLDSCKNAMHEGNKENNEAQTEDYDEQGTILDETGETEAVNNDINDESEHVSLEQENDDVTTQHLDDVETK